MSEYNRAKHRNWLKIRNNLKHKNNLTSHDNLSSKTDHTKHFLSANQENKWKYNSRTESTAAPYIGAEACRHSFASPEGTILHYQIIGNGPPLVLLHGRGQRHLIFRQQIEYFKGRYKLILIDGKQTGISSIGPFNLAAKSLAEDTIQVLDHLHIRKAVIIGYGDGGNTALQLALKAPLMIQALIMADSNIVSNELNTAASSLRKIQSKVLDFLEKLKIPCKAKRAAIQSKNGYPHLSAEELAKLNVPVLIISAGKNTLRSKYAKKLAGNIPRSEFMCINQARHLGILTHSDEYNFIFQNFLRKLDIY